MGYGKRELFIQFLTRIYVEIPGCVIGQFSKLKHLQGPKFNEFRDFFRASLEKCFLVPADTFDNVKGQFPIGFFVWRLWNEADIACREADSRRRKEIREFLGGEPVVRLTGREFEGLSRKEILNAAYLDWGRVGHRVLNPEIGEVELSRSGIHDSLGHGAGRNKIAALACMPEIIANAREVLFRRNWKGRGYDSHIVVAPISIAERAYVAIVIVNSSVNGNKFYLHEVGALEEIKNTAEVMRTGSSDVESALSRNLGDIKSLAYSLFAVNGWKWKI